MSQPLVTIITPTYNRPAMFAECAAAVLAQSFTDWVWWVVFNDEMESTYAACHYDFAFFRDPRCVPLWYPIGPRQRNIFHIPACIVNWLYPKVTTDYIYFLADDDLIDPDGLKTLVNHAYRDASEDHLGWITKPLDAVYGRCEVVDQRPDGTYAHACWTYDAGDVGLGTGIDPHCRLDGGQVLHTVDLWRRATRCDACDGSGQIIGKVDFGNKPLTTEYQVFQSHTTYDPCAACNATGIGWQLTDSKDAGANDGVLLHRLAEFARFHYVPTRIVTHRRHAGATHHKPQVKP